MSIHSMSSDNLNRSSMDDSGSMKKNRSLNVLYPDARKLVLLPDSWLMESLTNMGQAGRRLTQTKRDSMLSASYGSGMTRQMTDRQASQTSTTAELEWDKYMDFRRKQESNRMSVYDIDDNIAELIRLKLLEFESMSMCGSVKTQPELGNVKVDDDPTNEPNETENSRQLRKMTNASFSSLGSMSFLFNGETQSELPSTEYTPADGLTLEDFFQIKLKSLQESLRAAAASNAGPAGSQTIMDSVAMAETPGYKAPVFSTLMYAPLTFDVESLYASIDPSNKNRASMFRKQDSTHDSETNALNFYHSMPDLRLFSSLDLAVSTAYVPNEDDDSSFKSIRLNSKHLSLLDMRSFEWIYIKSTTRQDIHKTNAKRIDMIKNLKLDLKLNYSSMRHLAGQATTTTTNPQPSMESTAETGSVTESAVDATNQPDLSLNQQTPLLSNPRPSVSGPSVNFSRMSRLSMLRSYMNRIGQKVKQMLVEVFNGAEIDNHPSTAANVNFSYNVKTNNLYSINEESIDSYEVIEIIDDQSNPKPDQADYEQHDLSTKIESDSENLIQN